MTITVQQLADDPELCLRIVDGGARWAGRRVDADVSWAYASDLADPTPWLEPGYLLLTNGGQFGAQVGDEAAWEYAERLEGAEVAALGFATGIVHDRIPDELVRACRLVGLPLLEVTDRRPFIAIIRRVADAVASDSAAQLRWAQQAQRAVARAALRPNGLVAILSELERQLGGWVALFDARGAQMETSAQSGLPEALRLDVRQEVEAMLIRGSRAGRSLALGGRTVQLQTIGSGSDLLGILAAAATEEFDRERRDLVDSVVAIASIALEQSRSLELARGQLRRGLLDLLVGGRLDVAASVAERMWGGLPEEPIVAIDAAFDARPRRAIAALETLCQSSGGQVLHAETDEGLLVAVPAASEFAAAAEAAILQAGATAGSSTPLPWSSFDQAVDESRRARLRSAPGELLPFASVARTGLMGHLEATGGAGIARGLLAPLLDADGAGEETLGTLEIWLEENCAWGPAARRLGIHRHTLRHRVDAASSALGRDLERFEDRAEVWAAIRLVRDR